MRCKNRKEDEDNMKKASIAKIAIYIFLILLAFIYLAPVSYTHLTLPTTPYV